MVKLCIPQLTMRTHIVVNQSNKYSLFGKNCMKIVCMN